MTSRLAMAALAAAALVVAACAPALAQPARPLPTLTVSAFNPPSLGSFIPTHSIEEAFVLGQRVLVMRRPGQVAAEFDVPLEASPARIADLRARVLDTMAALKQAAVPWHSDGGPGGNSGTR